MLFVCEGCQHIENTASGEYWGRWRRRCSKCATGEWHGQFPRERYDKAKHGPIMAGRIVKPEKVRVRR